MINTMVCKMQKVLSLLASTSLLITLQGCDEAIQNQQKSEPVIGELRGLAATAPEVGWVL